MSVSAFQCFVDDVGISSDGRGGSSSARIGLNRVQFRDQTYA